MVSVSSTAVANTVYIGISIPSSDSNSYELLVDEAYGSTTQ
jgi:hypothetical protein